MLFRLDGLPNSSGLDLFRSVQHRPRIARYITEKFNLPRLCELRNFSLKFNQKAVQKGARASDLGLSFVGIDFKVPLPRCDYDSARFAAAQAELVRQRSGEINVHKS